MSVTAASSSRQQLPRDARLISLILASKGVQDADDSVINQLLDFAHRYSADVLQSAQSLADHASRPGSSRIEKDDVELAIQMRRRYEFFEPPPRDYLASLAHELNSQPLPILPETFDLLRLPPPHQRLGEVNFNLVPNSTLDLNTEGFEEDDDDSSGSEEDEAPTADEDVSVKQDADGEGSDEDMEEVGMTAPLGNEREIDEDYDD